MNIPPPTSICPPGLLCTINTNPSADLSSNDVFQVVVISKSILYPSIIFIMVPQYAAAA